MSQEVLKATKSRVLRPDIIFSKLLFSNTRNCSSINVFKKELLKFIRPEPNSTYDINDTEQLKLLTRLRLGLSHLGDRKFRRKCVFPMCYCAQDIQTKTHFLLHCANHYGARKTLFHKINRVNGTISRQSDSTITIIMLFRYNKPDFETNKILLISTIEFISLTRDSVIPYSIKT